MSSLCLSPLLPSLLFVRLQKRWCFLLLKERHCLLHPLGIQGTAAARPGADALGPSRLVREAACTGPAREHTRWSGSRIPTFAQRHACSSRCSLHTHSAQRPFGSLSQRKICLGLRGLKKGGVRRSFWGRKEAQVDGVPVNAGADKRKTGMASAGRRRGAAAKTTLWEYWEGTEGSEIGLPLT